MITTDTLEHISQNVPHIKWYIGEDGLRHCKECGSPLQTTITLYGKLVTVSCICKCRKTALDAEDTQKRIDDMDARRKICFGSSFAEMSKKTFASDDCHCPSLTAAMQRYCSQFQHFRQERIGLLLHGTVGGGKTFFAAAIANKLIDAGYRVLMTNFTRISNDLFSAHDKNAYIDSLNRYSMLIIDDLGVERSSEYMVENVYAIIDGRYRSGLPVIITTNIPIETIKKPQDVNYARIYDRILQMCHPIEIAGGSRRRAEIRERYTDLQKRLGL